MFKHYKILTFSILYKKYRESGKRKSTKALNAIYRLRSALFKFYTYFTPSRFHIIRDEREIP